MVIVDILRDGNLFPPIKTDGLVVRLLSGRMQVGRYDKNRYMNDSTEYILEPRNATTLKNELIPLVNKEMPELFSKHYIVHFICPENISLKARWEEENVISSSL